MLQLNIKHYYTIHTFHRFLIVTLSFALSTIFSFNAQHFLSKNINFPLLGSQVWFCFLFLEKILITIHLIPSHFSREFFFSNFNLLIFSLCIAINKCELLCPHTAYYKTSAYIFSEWISHCTISSYCLKSKLGKKKKKL